MVVTFADGTNNYSTGTMIGPNHAITTSNVFKVLNSDGKQMKKIKEVEFYSALHEKSSNFNKVTAIKVFSYKDRVTDTKG